MLALGNSRHSKLCLNRRTPLTGHFVRLRYCVVGHIWHFHSNFVHWPTIIFFLSVRETQNRANMRTVCFHTLVGKRWTPFDTGCIPANCPRTFRTVLDLLLLPPVPHARCYTYTSVMQRVPSCKEHPPPTFALVEWAPISLTSWHQALQNMLVCLKCNAAVVLPLISFMIDKRPVETRAFIVVRSTGSCMDYLLLTKIWLGEVTILLRLLWHLSTSAVSHGCWVDNCGCYPTLNECKPQTRLVLSFTNEYGNT